MIFYEQIRLASDWLEKRTRVNRVANQDTGLIEMYISRIRDKIHIYPLAVTWEKTKRNTNKQTQRQTNKHKQTQRQT